MLNNDIKVSVIIPIYNAYDYLKPALDTIIDQTLREIEIICIDDGSTDRSLDIIKEYQKTDERIRIVTENNAGVSTARNKGIIRARGKYIIFLDADDFSNGFAAVTNDRGGPYGYINKKGTVCYVISLFFRVDPLSRAGLVFLHHHLLRR